jgi:HAMP domain-containing protein
MSTTFRRHVVPYPQRPAGTAGEDGPDPAGCDLGLLEAAGPRLAWLGGIGALAGLGLAAGLYLAWQEPEEAPPAKAAASWPEPPRAEPATLAGMGRALAVLERDLSVWHRLTAPPGLADPGAPRVVPQDQAAPLPAMAEAVDPAASAPPQSPDRLALIMLAVMLAAVTLVTGLGVMLLERMLLGPFRAMREAAAALSGGDLDTPIPGTGRDDEAGVLARTLERLRRVAQAAQAERDLDPSCLAEAALRLEVAARQFECAAAAAAALALQDSLDAGAADGADAAPHVALGVSDLAQEVVAIRQAAARAADAIDRLSQGARQPAPLPIPVESYSG